MLKKLKQTALKSLKTAGVSTLVHNSRWRRQRLLILAYHGVSIDDEHLWNSSMSMPPEVFRKRLEMLKKSGCAILPLAEAIARMYARDLPDRSVAITFDDGNADFHQRAFPLLREFGFPVTLYLTTFYSQFNRPIFGIFCEYLLWKGRHQTLDLKPIMGRDVKFNLWNAPARAAAFGEINAFATKQDLLAEEKDALAAKLASQLELDYDELIEKRIMHLVTPAEVKQLAIGGADIQLHTHRHRTPLERELFLREIEDNRERIESMTGARATHFCYPSGVYDHRFLPWLREAGVVSATTCETGFASRGSNQLLLPRFLDSGALSAIEFESWLAGVSVLLPRRRIFPGAKKERDNNRLAPTWLGGYTRL